jgi:hypothetical protein
MAAYPFRPRPRDWLPTAAVLSLQLLLAFALFAPAWSHPTSVLVGNQIDSGPHAWFLNWTSFSLSHGHSPLTSDWIGWPQGANLAWNTTMIPFGLAMTPVELLAGPVVAFNLAITLAVALTAFAAFLALRRYTGELAAAAGATLFGFSPYFLAHAGAGHVNLVAAAAIPMLLVLLDEVVVRQRLGWLGGGALLGGLVALQAYAAEELVATEVVAAAAGLLVLAAVAAPAARIVMWRRAAWRTAWTVAAALPVFAVVAGPLLWTQFLGANHISGAVQPRGRYVTDLANLVVPTATQALAPARATALSGGFTGNLGEWSGYLGIPLLVAAAATLAWQWRRTVVRWAAGMAVVMSVLSLGPVLHVGGADTGISLPWRVLGHLPLLDNVLPGRMSVYVFLCLALLVACGVDALVRTRHAVAYAGALLVVAAVAAPLAPAVPFPSRPATTPAVFTSAALQKLPQGSVAYVLPSVAQDTMLWQVQSGMHLRMLGGWFFGPDPQGHVQQGPRATPLTRAVADVESSGDVILTSADALTRYRAELKNDRVRAIVVTPYEPHAAAVVQFFQLLTGTPPRDDGSGSRYWITG